MTNDNKEVARALMVDMPLDQMLERIEGAIRALAVVKQDNDRLRAQRDELVSALALVMENVNFDTLPSAIANDLVVTVGVALQHAKDS